ncbi:sensor histidine kinase [Arachnia propionica]|nr:histidine kinase [Arachnia propionica]
MTSRPLPVGWVAAGLTVVALALTGAPRESPRIPLLPMLLVAAVGALAVWLAWRRGVQRRRYERALADAAAHDAVLRERIAIARDLHDIVSHGLGAVTVRAEAGRRLIDLDPEEGRRALAEVVALSREATGELRRLLTVLKDPEAAPLHPTPGLAEVAELVAQTRRRGVTVDADVATDVAAAPGVQLTAYTVVREALANVWRHAGPTTARVSVAVVDEMLLTHVIDDGPVPGWVPERGSGHGLELLRTRVELHGGTLHHGPLGAGYEVRASLPLGER